MTPQTSGSRSEALDRVDAAIFTVAASFPFPGYIEASPHAYRDVAEAAIRYAPSGGRVLDFAAGPLDKTAVLARLGFECFAFDDLRDPWHLIANNRERILSFARTQRIDYRIAPDPLPEGPFDMVMAHDVLEHLHDSPRSVIFSLVDRLVEGGVLLVSVPNAANLRKRLALLRGETNMPEYGAFFWSEGSWRGHIREYVRRDLEQLAAFSGLEVLELRTAHHLAHRLPLALRLPYRAITAIVRDARDSWLLAARKPVSWSRPEPDPELIARLTAASSPYFSRAAEVEAGGVDVASA